jgi:hypothetical protein
MKRQGLPLFLVMGLLLMAGTAYAMSSRNFRLDWYDQLSGAGGPQLASETFAGDVTVGQPAIRASTSVSYSVQMGYWSAILKPPAPLVPAAFLPLVLRQPLPTPTPTPTTPPGPAIPTLNAIAPPEASATYLVSWSVAARAESYVLEQATGSGFTDAVQVYAGPARQQVMPGEGIANYHYRVKGRNAQGDSGWSDAQTVEVRWEREPNEQISELDNRSRLMFGKAHYGTMATDLDIDPDPSRGRDYFYFDMDVSRAVELWLEDIPAGSNYDLYIRPDWDIQQIIGYSINGGNAAEHVRLEPQALPAGHRYFVQVYNQSHTRSTQPYRLTIQ